MSKNIRRLKENEWVDYHRVYWKQNWIFCRGYSVASTCNHAQSNWLTIIEQRFLITSQSITKLFLHCVINKWYETLMWSLQLSAVWIKHFYIVFTVFPLGRATFLNSHPELLHYNWVVQWLSQSEIISILTDKYMNEIETLVHYRRELFNLKSHLYADIS